MGIARVIEEDIERGTLEWGDDDLFDHDDEERDDEHTESCDYDDSEECEACQ